MEDVRFLERCIPRWVTALAVTVFAESSRTGTEDWRRSVSFEYRSLLVASHLTSHAFDTE